MVHYEVGYRGLGCWLPKEPNTRFSPLALSRLPLSGGTTHPPPPPKNDATFPRKKTGAWGPGWANGRGRRRRGRSPPAVAWRNIRCEGGREGDGRWSSHRKERERTWRAESGGRRRKKQKEFIILSVQKQGSRWMGSPRALLILTCALATERSVLTSCFRWWAVRRTPEGVVDSPESRERTDHTIRRGGPLVNRPTIPISSTIWPTVAPLVALSLDTMLSAG